MITRVNFIEREIFVLTYRKMGYLLGALLGVFLLLYGVQVLRVEVAGRRTIRLESEVKQLKDQRDQILAHIVAAGGPSSQTDQAIRTSFEMSPLWSQTLRELGRVMPPSLWLVSIKSYPRSDTSQSRGLLLSGEAEEPEQISLFLKELSHNRRFETPVLTNSKEEKRGVGSRYVFTIDLGVVPHREGGGF